MFFSWFVICIKKIFAMVHNVHHSSLLLGLCFWVAHGAINEARGYLEALQPFIYLEALQPFIYLEALQPYNRIFSRHYLKTNPKIIAPFFC
jgi:hypothetical protein